MMQNLIPIREIFGPTIQGEGLHAGRLATFIRVAGCDSRCEWCDTKYAWDVADTRVKMMSAEQIAESVIRKPSLNRLVVITGGNPCIYDLHMVIDMLKESDYEIHIETQGTIIPAWLSKVDFVSLSPKRSYVEGGFYATAGERSIIKGMIKELGDTPHQLKFVIGNDCEYTLALEMAKSNPLEVVMFQPKYTDGIPNSESITALADKICNDVRIPPNVCFMPQLHRVIWGDANGV